MWLLRWTKSSVWQEVTTQWLGTTKEAWWENGFSRSYNHDANFSHRKAEWAVSLCPPGSGSEAAKHDWPGGEAHFPVLLRYKRDILRPFLLQAPARILWTQVWASCWNPGSEFQISRSLCVTYRHVPVDRKKIFNHQLFQRLAPYSKKRRFWEKCKLLHFVILLPLRWIFYSTFLWRAAVPVFTVLCFSLTLNMYKVTGQFPWSSLKETDRGVSAEFNVSSLCHSLSPPAPALTNVQLR